MPENNNIEDFFRRRLESHELNFQEEDWQLLEKRLETVHPSPAMFEVHFSPKTILIIVTALTAAFLLGWMASELFQDSRTKKMLPEHIKQPEVKTENDQVHSYSTERNPVSSNTELNKSLPLYSKKKQISTPTVKQKRGSDHPGIEQKRVVAAPAFLIKSYGMSLTGESRMESTESASVEELNSIPVDFIRISPPDITGFEISPSIVNKRPAGYDWNGRWSIGLILAPDYNGVTLFRGNTVTAAVGGLISFQLTPRWSASMKAIYNNKKYNSQPRYYKLPEGYWISRTKGIIPENIAGSCRVIDIPVMLTYMFMQNKKISLTASAGIGNYFMLDEKYEFEFNQNNPGADTKWQTKENSTVLLGTANIALGIGFQTTPRLNISFEPYLKIPLKEIGWGNVNLYSMGLSLNMYYRL